MSTGLTDGWADRFLRDAAAYLETPSYLMRVATLAGVRPDRLDHPGVRPAGLGGVEPDRPDHPPAAAEDVGRGNVARMYRSWGCRFHFTEQLFPP